MSKFNFKIPGLVIPRFLVKPLEIAKQVSSAEGSLFVYALSYSLLLGLAPFLIIAVMVIGNYVFSVEQIIGFLTQYIPAILIEPFVNYIMINNFNSFWALITLLGAAVWVASKSVHSFLLNSMVQDGIVVRGIILRILSLAYFLFIVVIVMVSGVIISLIDLPAFFVLPLLLIVFFYILYHLLSFRQIKFKELMMGSLFSTVSILLIGRLFFFIVNTFFNYDTIYGPFASVMILLLSLNLISMIIYIGYLITNVYRDKNSPIKRGVIEILAKL